MSRAEVDVAVVGAGSAGCALAARLSEDSDRRVVLLEAGGHGRDPRIQVPAFFAALHGSRHDWRYRTEPQSQLNGRRLRWPRGRVLGGSSSTNYLVFLRGHPACYDAWRDAGCEGWGFEDLLPVFRRLEDHPLGPSCWHGAGGPVGISGRRWINPLTDAFLAAAERAGVARSPDLDGSQPEGVAHYWVNTRDGRRESAATAYLDAAAGRLNLEVRTGALVQRLLFRDGRAVAVELAAGGAVETLGAGTVVLCAGAVATPAILLRSGVGPAEELDRLEVPAITDSPEVGASLADHTLVPVVLAGPRRLTMPEAALGPRAALAYRSRREGPWSSNVAEAGAILRTRPDAGVPDLQLTFGVASFLNHGRTAPQRSFSIGVVALQPRSRGRIWLRDRDPRTPPAIDPNYFADEVDLTTTLNGVAVAREIAATEPLARLGTREREPGTHVVSDEQVIAWIRRRAQTSYHPVGTCRMGSDRDSVVDPRLRVRGVQGLYVADASIMPRIVSANTNAACMMIGERGAELVAEGET